MKQLPDEIYRKVEAFSSEGNSLSEIEEHGRAVEKWTEALNLIPQPQADWEASTWLLASIGDGYFHAGDFPAARDALTDALKCPGGTANPFVHYMLGSALFKMNDESRGLDHLLRAYMLDGTDIFESDEVNGSENIARLKTVKLI